MTDMITILVIPTFWYFYVAIYTHLKALMFGDHNLKIKIYTIILSIIHIYVQSTTYNQHTCSRIEPQKKCLSHFVQCTIYIHFCTIYTTIFIDYYMAVWIYMYMYFISRDRYSIFSHQMAMIRSIRQKFE